MREHRYTFLLVALSSSFLPIRRSVGGNSTTTSRVRDVGGRVEEGDPSAFSVNLFGIPEIPEALPRAISPARLHNIVFISSCNLVHASHRLSPVSSHRPPPSHPLARLSPSLAARSTLYTRRAGTEVVAGGGRRVRLVPGFGPGIASYTRAPKWAIRELQENPRRRYALPLSPSEHSFFRMLPRSFSTSFRAALPSSVPRL